MIVIIIIIIKIVIIVIDQISANRFTYLVYISVNETIVHPRQRYALCSPFAINVPMIIVSRLMPVSQNV